MRCEGAREQVELGGAVGRGVRPSREDLEGQERGMEGLWGHLFVCSYTFDPSRHAPTSSAQCRGA